MTDINAEIAMEYAVVRRTNPVAGVDDVVKKIVQRLRDEGSAPVDSDAPWDEEADDGPDELTMLVRNFVLAVEDD